MDRPTGRSVIPMHVGADGRVVDELSPRERGEAAPQQHDGSGAGGGGDVRTYSQAAPSQLVVAAGGTLGMPCLCSSDMTLSSDGGLSPRGSGSHGFTKTSPMAASMLSLDCTIYIGN